MPEIQCPAIGAFRNPVDVEAAVGELQQSGIGMKTLFMLSTLSNAAEAVDPHAPVSRQPVPD